MVFEVMPPRLSSVGDRVTEGEPTHAENWSSTTNQVPSAATANSLFHYQPENTAKPPAKIEAAARSAIDNDIAKGSLCFIPNKNDWT